MVQGMRQAIAMCICLWAIDQCVKRKFIRFAIIVVIASLFHASAFVFAAVYFIAIFKINIESFVAFSILAGAFAIVFPQIFDLVNTVINDNYGLNDGSNEGGIFAILIYIAIIMFGLVFKDRNDKQYALFVYMAIIGLVCMMLRLTSSAIIERVSYFYAFSQMVVISDSVNSLRVKRERAILSMIVFALCFGVAIYKASYSVLIPYMFFWQG